MTLGLVLKARAALRRLLEMPNMLQDTRRHIQGAPKTTQDAPKSTPRCPKTPQDASKPLCTSPKGVVMSRRFNRRVASIQVIETIKTRFLENWSKSGFGSILVHFWIRIRILHDKLHLVIGSDPFFIDFEIPFSKTS